MALVKYFILTLSLFYALVPATLCADPVRVAAAADLTHALIELEERFHAQSGYALSISFGSSGNLTRQIMQGAPFEIFFSANEDYVFKLADQGLTKDRGIAYALGHLALFVPQTSDLPLAADLSTLREARDKGSLRRLAMANPEHAPYGMAAREALQRSGLWGSIPNVLILGENAAQAARFAVSGSVDAGLIPYSIAVTPSFAARGRSVLVADTLYTPLRQRMVLVKGAGPGAVALFNFMRSTAAIAILTRYGFAAPAAE